ncbi:tetratricopeptide (TPR) repeat protein [Kitasatospora herbaricolor]|nr:tetratricopeptide (TPR) repeat protein [Kitasatospora herbaricolor]
MSEDPGRGFPGRGFPTWLLESLARTGHLAQAAELAYATGGRTGPGDTLLALVEAAAHAGDLRGAQALAESIPERDAHDRALVALVPAWARSGERGRAVALAERVRYPHHWGRAWATLAKAEADRGDMAAALECAARADESASMAGGVASPDVLALLVEVAVVAGDAAWAAELADRMQSPAAPIGYDRRGGGLHPLARVLACEALQGDLRRIDALLTSPEESADADVDLPRTDGPDPAREDPEPDPDRFTHLLPDPSSGPLVDARVMADLVHAVAESADHDLALALADRAEGLLDTGAARHSHDLLEAVILLLAGRGHHLRAMALADRFDEPSLRSARQARIVREVARHGDVDRAEYLARAISDRPAAVVALLGVVHELARRGLLDRAQELAGSFTDAWDRDEALTAVVHGLARQGSMSRAESLASSIVHRAARARALASLVELSPPPRARRLAAQAVVLDGWAAVLDVLEPIVPRAAATVADQLGRRAPEHVSC